MFNDLKIQSPQITLPQLTYQKKTSTFGMDTFRGIGNAIKNFFTPKTNQPVIGPTQVAGPMPVAQPPQPVVQPAPQPIATQPVINTQPVLQTQPTAPSQQTPAVSPLPTPIALNPQIKDEQGYIPSTSLSSNTTYQDVLAKRKQLEDAYMRELQRASDIYGQGLQAVENARYSGETLPFAQGQTERIQRNADLASLAATNRAQAYGQMLGINQQNLQNLVSTQSNIIGSPQVNQTTGDVFVTTQNPTTGQVSVMSAGNIGPQKSYVSSSIQQDPATKQLIFTGVKPDGSVETKVLSEGAAEQPGGVLSSLPTSVQTKLISIANDFGGTDIVKRFNATVDGINLVNNIPPNTKNPSDHQTIVYAFAKSLDPDSVVREGEYATIKKYAQSLISAYGKEISNAINGTGFLSAKAIENIKKAMNNNYQSRKPAYDNLYNEKSRIINNLAGADVAKDVMIDYSQGASTPSTGQNVIQTKIGPVDNSWFE